MKRRILSFFIIAILIVSSLIVAVICVTSEDDCEASSHLVEDPVHYYVKDNTGYPINRTILSKEPIDMVSSVTVSSGGIVKTDKNEFYTVNNPIEVSIDFRVSMVENVQLAHLVRLSNDTETMVDGTLIQGTVSTGVVLIRTSVDGRNYETFFQIHIGGNLTLPFTLGPEVFGSGKYVQIIVAYEIKYGLNVIYDCYNVLEIHEFRACVTNLGAVTVHNRSIDTGSIYEDNGTTRTIEYYEDMKDGSMTMEGFTIRGLYTAGARLEVWKDDRFYQVCSPIEFNDEFWFSEEGIYRLRYYCPFDKTLYQERSIAILSYYSLSSALFPVLRGNAVESDIDVPAYKNLSFIMRPSELIPVFKATITNESFGTTTVVTNEEDVQIKLENGVYKIVLCPKDVVESGDVPVITLRFKSTNQGETIAPHINYEMLSSSYTVTDMKQSFYTLKTPTSGIGSVLWAFPDKESAVKFGTKYQFGLVEEKDNGTMVWKDGTYIDRWDLTVRINEWIADNVQTYCFDPNDELTYMTINLDDMIGKEQFSSEDFESLTIDKDVILFCDRETRDSLRIYDGPIISMKRYSVLHSDGTVESFSEPSVFLKDYKSVTSSIIEATQMSNYEAETLTVLPYDEDLCEKLLELKFQPGFIRIHERSSGGNSYYDVLLIPDGVFTATGKIDYTQDGIRKGSDIKEVDTIVCSSFTFVDMKDLSGENYVIFDDGSGPEYYQLYELEGKKIDEKGMYSLKIINSTGFVKEISIEVR